MSERNSRSERSSRDDRGGSSKRDRGDEREERGSRRGGRDDDRGGRSNFRYQPRNADNLRKRGEQSGGDYDNYIQDNIKLYKPCDGDNLIRIMPPTWKDAEHFGLDIFVHYGVGPDSQTYLCLDKMKGEPCPICDERARAVKDNDQEYADKLKPTKRVLVYLIDRNNEKEGPFAWSMPWTIDRDLCKLVVDKKTGDTLPIDDPENGYDIEFERKGKGDRTQYIGLAVARRESDLGSERWLEFIQENPLSDALKFYEYDHITKVFGGTIEGKSKRGGDDTDRRQDRDLKRVEERSSRKGGDELSWEDIHEMTFDEMCDLIDDKRLDIDADKSKDDEDLADWICEEMKIKKEARRESRDADSPDDKMEKMRSRRRLRE